MRIGSSYLDESEYEVNIYGPVMLVEISMGYIAMRTEELVVELH